MPSIIHLSTIWEHILTVILNHNNKTEVGTIMRSWVKHYKLEDMTDLLMYDLNDFTPTGTLYYYKESAEEKNYYDAKYTCEEALQPLQVHTASHSQVQIQL